MSDQGLWVPPSAEREIHQRLSNFRRGSRDGEEESDEVREMRLNRRVNQKLSTAIERQGGASVSFATGRTRDPMFYWRANNLPYDITKDDHLQKIRAWCRILYLTHPIVASAIDVYSNWPLTGMELVCKDSAITDFHTELFFDQLNYEEYLPEVGREYWTVGESFPLGSFNEMLGVWEEDELINPDDVEVHRSPFLREPRLTMKVPEVIRKILREREPAWEYEQLLRYYPELANFTREDDQMPVSNILLKHLKFKADTFHPRGIPILMRAFRALIQEEMLNAAQDAIADRLYTPLVLAKLGASASDLGTQKPWIPTDDDLRDFEEALDAALAGDFRVLVHHFALDMAAVFGREQMPNLDADFERLTDRLLQSFGLSRTMLTGAEGGQTYAADALNRDLISQLLSRYQRLIQRLFRDRALVVAEAQEHYDYDKRGDQRYPVMEEIYEVDEETGEERIIEQPKLLVPDLKLKAMNMRDEADLRQFYEALRGAGVPISMKTRLVNVPIDLDEEVETSRDEAIRMAVEAQETRKATYEALRSKGLPIPDDLLKDFEPKPRNEDDGQTADQGVLPHAGFQDPATGADPLTPTGEDYAADPNVADAVMPGGPRQPATDGNVVRLPRNKMLAPGEHRSRPEESDEQRARMPRPAALRREEKRTEGEDGEEIVEVTEQWEEVDDEVLAAQGSHRLMSGPRHVGMRRFAGYDRNTPLPDDRFDEESPEANEGAS